MVSTTPHKPRLHMEAHFYELILSVNEPTLRGLLEDAGIDIDDELLQRVLEHARLDERARMDARRPVSNKQIRKWRQALLDVLEEREEQDGVSFLNLTIDDD